MSNFQDKLLQKIEDSKYQKKINEEGLRIMISSKDGKVIHHFELDSHEDVSIKSTKNNDLLLIKKHLKLFYIFNLKDYSYIVK